MNVGARSPGSSKKHAARMHECPSCGRVLFGNGGLAHVNRCGRAVAPVPDLSHRDLVGRAIAWLRGTRGCLVAYAELSTVASCVPDAIGWRTRGSELVEVKVSRSDFRRDAMKPAHRAGLLPGNMRWYLTPAGMLRPEEIPEGWGLVEATEARIRIVRAAPFLELTSAGSATERMMLVSVARRHGLGVQFDPVSGRFAPAGSEL